LKLLFFIKHAPDDDLDGQVILPTRRKARIDGFALDAEVAVQAHDHERREGLLRDFLRPPLSHDRLRDLPSPGGGVVFLQLKKPSNDRTTHIELTPSAFLTRLASLVPRPRKNTSLYFGVLAANARGRKQFVRKIDRRVARNEDASWAALVKHTFGLDVLGCFSLFFLKDSRLPRCQGAGGHERLKGAEAALSREAWEAAACPTRASPSQRRSYGFALEGR
jgi:hypothetical protein